MARGDGGGRCCCCCGGGGGGVAAAAVWRRPVGGRGVGQPPAPPPLPPTAPPSRRIRALRARGMGGEWGATRVGGEVGMEGRAGGGEGNGGRGVRIESSSCAFDCRCSCSVASPTLPPRPARSAPVARRKALQFSWLSARCLVWIWVGRSACMPVGARERVPAGVITGTCRARFRISAAQLAMLRGPCRPETKNSTYSFFRALSPHVLGSPGSCCLQEQGQRLLCV
jgi:hypothetical protein